MFFSKEKLYIGQFCRIFCQSIIKAPPHDLEIIDLEKKINKEDIKEINNELLNFRLIVFFYLLLEKSAQGKIRKTAEELGYIASHAFVLSLQDNKWNNDEINKLNLNELLDEYLSYLEKMENEDNRKREFGFYLCNYFSNKIMPISNNQDETQKYKSLFAFNVAKQVFKLVKDDFNYFFNKVKIID